MLLSHMKKKHTAKAFTNVINDTHCIIYLFNCLV